ncbi:MAG TPA: hypothetical protein VGJ54_06820, partial [Streptosporangiaceae bacterium]
MTVMRAGKGPRMVAEDSSREVWLRHARSHLRNADPVLARLIDDRPDFDPQAWLDNPFGLPPTMDLFGALLLQITGQQLSIPATAGPWPASRRCSAAICPRPPNCWAPIPPSCARPGYR